MNSPYRFSTYCLLAFGTSSTYLLTRPLLRELATAFDTQIATILWRLFITSFAVGFAYTLLAICRAAILRRRQAAIDAAYAASDKGRLTAVRRHVEGKISQLHSLSVAYRQDVDRLKGHHRQVLYEINQVPHTERWIEQARERCRKYAAAANDKAARLKPIEQHLQRLTSIRNDVIADQHALEHRRDMTNLHLERCDFERQMRELEREFPEHFTSGFYDEFESLAEDLLLPLEDFPGFEDNPQPPAQEVEDERPRRASHLLLGSVTLVDRIAAGEPEALTWLALTVVGLFLLVAFMNWFTKTRFFRWTSIVVALLLAIGFFLDAGTMFDLCRGCCLWLADRLLEG